jgi:hypothetical protein
LLFVGTKMLISDWYHMPVPISLGVVLGVLLVSVAASVLVHKKVEEEGLEAAPPEVREAAAVVEAAVRRTEEPAATGHN